MAVTKKILNQYDVKFVDGWMPPDEGDVRPLIAMPNIPRPLHGVNPRTILGGPTWNRMRRRCYAMAENTCEICGAKPENLRHRHGHEVYEIDYVNGTAKFVKVFCVCSLCVDEDTDVLTKDGWKKIPDVTTEDYVACWDKDWSITFQKPQATIKSYHGEAIEISGRGKKLYFSENHRLPLKVASKQSPSYGQVKDVLAKDYKASHYYNWITGGNGVGKGHLSAEERVYIAIEANGHLAWDKNDVGTRSDPDGERQKKWSNRYGSEEYRYTYVVHLYKTRKIERLKELLEESGLRHQITKQSDGYCDFNIWTNKECKHFKNCFDISMPSEKALEFIEELVFWDGTHSKGQTSWFTNKKEEADFVQAIAAQCNVLATVIAVNRIGNLRKGEWTTPYDRLTYAVNLHSIHNEYCTRELKPKRVKWGKEMYCLTVPTSYFVARRDGMVFVTGNCHLGCIHTGRALTLWKKKNPLYPTEFLLEGAEHAFKIINEYNKDNPDADLRAYSTFLDYLKHEELKEPMEKLIDKYSMKFYTETKAIADWGDWKLIIGNQEHKTPFANKDEWEAAMEEKEKKDTDRILQKSINKIFSGELYEELDKILKGGKNEPTK